MKAQGQRPGKSKAEIFASPERAISMVQPLPTAKDRALSGLHFHSVPSTQGVALGCLIEAPSGQSRRLLMLCGAVQVAGDGFPLPTRPPRSTCPHFFTKLLAALQPIPFLLVRRTTDDFPIESIARTTSTPENHRCHPRRQIGRAHV